LLFSANFKADSVNLEFIDDNLYTIRMLISFKIIMTVPKFASNTV